MATASSEYQDQVLEELEAIPREYMPLLLRLIRAYRESVMLKPAAASFRQGWKEARSGKVRPVKELWEGIDAE